MAHEEITTTLSSVVEKQTVSDQRLDRVEQLLDRFANNDQQHDERLTRLDQMIEKLTEGQFKQDLILEKPAEKQFKQDLKNEEIDNRLTRTAQLLMQSALKNVEAN